MTRERKLKSLERFVEKLDAMNQKAIDELEPLPEPDDHGMVRMRNQDLMKLIQQRAKLAYCNGAYRMFVYVIE